VAGLIGSFSQTTTPQIPPPHLLTRTFVARLRQPDAARLSTALRVGWRRCKPCRQDRNDDAESASHGASKNARLK